MRWRNGNITHRRLSPRRDAVDERAPVFAIVKDLRHAPSTATSPADERRRYAQAIHG
jgi:hypothetical protein